jgi:hypothetical protein
VLKLMQAAPLQQLPLVLLLKVGRAALTMELCSQLHLICSKWQPWQCQQQLV